jgi:hypothetical protein
MTGDVLFSVSCHGETEEVRLPFADLVRAKGVTMGQAFATPRQLRAAMAEEEGR